MLGRAESVQRRPVRPNLLSFPSPRPGTMLGQFLRLGELLRTCAVLASCFRDRFRGEGCSDQPSDICCAKDRVQAPWPGAGFTPASCHKVSLVNQLGRTSRFDSGLERPLDSRFENVAHRWPWSRYQRHNRFPCINLVLERVGHPRSVDGRLGLSARRRIAGATPEE